MPVGGAGFGVLSTVMHSAELPTDLLYFPHRPASLLNNPQSLLCCGARGWMGQTQVCLGVLRVYLPVPRAQECVTPLPTSLPMLSRVPPSPLMARCVYDRQI